MARKGMVIDLKRCIGCQACTIACKAENGTSPRVFWTRVLETESGKFPQARRDFLPILCNHCKDPVCKTVCPTGATFQRPDGLVLVDKDKCIGCRACITACPYHVRFYRRKSRTYYPQGATPYEEMQTTEQNGIVTKCTFCAHRVDKGLVPACVQACLTNARTFGDLDDPLSPVSRVLRERHPYQLRPEMGTDPSVIYLP